MKVDPVDRTWFLHRDFNSQTPAGKAFALLLTHEGPRSFISGELIESGPVVSEPNRPEFHHCVPRATFVDRGFNEEGGYGVDIFANIALLTRADNGSIGGSPPSQYRLLMPGQQRNDVDDDPHDRHATDLDEMDLGRQDPVALEQEPLFRDILARSFIPEILFTDNYRDFVEARAVLLADRVAELTGVCAPNGESK